MPSPALPAPIGVFDSGVGGLSVLRHIRAQLPHEDLMYFADSGHAPYGDKTEQYVVERALAVTDFLLSHGAKALVVACNTATVAAIKAVRTHPELPVVGVEPGLKPAAAATRNGKVGVLATARTLKGDKFLQLREQISAATQAEFLLQPAVGLVNEIEKGDLQRRPLPRCWSATWRRCWTKAPTRWCSAAPTTLSSATASSACCARMRAATSR
jgi:glutamate racemase